MAVGLDFERIGEQMPAQVDRIILNIPTKWMPWQLYDKLSDSERGERGRGAHAHVHAASAHLSQRVLAISLTRRTHPTHSGFLNSPSDVARCSRKSASRNLCTSPSRRGTSSPASSATSTWLTIAAISVSLDPVCYDGSP